MPQEHRQCRLGLSQAQSQARTHACSGAKSQKAASLRCLLHKSFWLKAQRLFIKRWIAADENKDESDDSPKLYDEEAYR